MEVYASYDALRATVEKVQLTAAGSLVLSGNNLTLKAIGNIPNPDIVLSTVTLPQGEPPISLTANRAVASNSSGKLVVSATTSDELGYVHGVTSPIQAQIDSKQPTITGAATTVTSNNLTASRAVISNSNGKLAVSSTTSTELGYVHGVTSSIQTQIDSKQPTITGASTTVASNNLTASRAVISNSNGKIAVSSTTSTELGYVHGVTSAIQTQIDSKQATITGAATTVTSNNLTASRAVISNSSGKIAVSSTTSTELGYVHGVTSSIQDQLDTLSSSKQNTITGAASTVVSNNLSPSMVVVSNASGKITTSGTISTTELGYLNNAKSNIQSQLNELKYQKGDTISGSCYIAGYLTTEGTGYRFTIPLTKPIIGSGLTITCTELKLAAIQNGSYLFGNDSTDYDAAGDGSTTISVANTASGLRMIVKLRASVGGTSNAPIGLRITSYKFTIS